MKKKYVALTADIKNISFEPVGIAGFMCITVELHNEEIFECRKITYSFENAIVLHDVYRHYKDDAPNLCVSAGH